MSRRTLIRWEQGEVSPWIPELKAVLAVLDLPEHEALSLVNLLESSRAKLDRSSDNVRLHGAAIRMARTRSGMLGADVARHLGCNPSQVTRWENGTLAPSDSETLHRLIHLGCEELDVLNSEQAFGELDRDVGVETAILGLTWPWDVESYRLFDARFLKLISELEQCLPKRVRGAKAAYAWMLLSASRFSEARELAQSVLNEHRAAGDRFSAIVAVSTCAAARCAAAAKTAHGAKAAIQMLDQLEGRPLNWELLANRFDAYAEVHVLSGNLSLANHYAEQAVDAAGHCGKRLQNLIRWSQPRILLAGGGFEHALAATPPFSEISPLNDAQEALTLAEIHVGLDVKEDSEHWFEVAGGINERFQLPETARRWSTPPLPTSL